MFWAEETRDIIAKFSTDPQQGLSESAYLASLNKYGPNVLRESKRTTQIELFLKQFRNMMSYLLILAGVVSFVLGENIDAIAIIAIVILNGIVGFIQESKAEASIAALKKLSTPKAKLIRDGKVRLVNSEDIVPGDILTLEAGDYIVADALVLTGFQLTADEAVLTGESLPVEKKSGVLSPETPLSDRTNMLHSGTALSSGSGKAIVVNTGMETEIGKIAGLLEATASEETPLQVKLTRVSNKLLILGLIVMIIVAVFEFGKGESLLNIFMLSISLAIAAIPEGLPAIVTLALALAIRRMSKRNAIVRKMSAVETLGSTDVICTDKTGTLTTGKMEVRNVFTLSSEDREELKLAAVACNNASLFDGGSGDPTEIALLRMAGEIDPPERIHEWTFESVRKRMSVAVRTESGIKLYCKGAPESLIPRCILSPVEKTEIEEKMKEFSMDGRRTLALAFRELREFDPQNVPPDDAVENSLHFLGLVAIADPPKEETIPAIRACRASGVKVVMITGDHPLTAEAIAHELGIIDEKKEGLVMTGLLLESLSPEELRTRCEEALVYARVSPEQKLKIVEALQANGHIVAMTGDGVNDSPALKRASIGVAMGRAGTEVARQASNMILTDDNFSTIVHAVEEGRAIFGNIKRTIQYLLSTNLAEILIVLGSVLLGMPRPFVPIALLWINLVTDGFPSLALAAEPVEKDFLKHSRTPSPESFFNRSFIREMFFVGLIMTIINLSVYGYLLRVTSEAMARTCAFHLLVYLCLFRSFSCRSETRLYSQLPLNLNHVLSVLIPVFLQIFLANTDSFMNLFEIGRLEVRGHGILILLSLIPVSFVELKKLLDQRPFLKKSSA